MHILISHFYNLKSRFSKFFGILVEHVWTESSIVSDQHACEVQGCEGCLLFLHITHKLFMWLVGVLVLKMYTAQLTTDFIHKHVRGDLNNYIYTCWWASFYAGLSLAAGTNTYWQACSDYF